MTVERAGTPRAVESALRRSGAIPLPSSRGSSTSMFLVVTPWFAFLLGVFVVGLRPRDPWHGSSSAS